MSIDREVNIEKDLVGLVAPLDLCKRIPAGGFTDTVFVWHCPGTWEGKDVWLVEYREDHKTDLPAPTLEEVLREMARYPHKYNNAGLEVDGDAFIVGAWLPNRWTPGKHLTEYRAQDGAAAALKLYLHQPEKKEEKTPCPASSN